MTIQISRPTDVKNHLTGIGVRVEKTPTTNALVVTDINGRETRFFFHSDGLYAGSSDSLLGEEDTIWPVYGTRLSAN